MVAGTLSQTGSSPHLMINERPMMRTKIVAVVECCFLLQMFLNHAFRRAANHGSLSLSL